MGTAVAQETLKMVMVAERERATLVPTLVLSGMIKETGEISGTIIHRSRMMGHGLLAGRTLTPRMRSRLALHWKKCATGTAVDTSLKIYTSHLSRAHQKLQLLRVVGSFTPCVSGSQILRKLSHSFRNFDRIWTCPCRASHTCRNNRILRDPC